MRVLVFSTPRSCSSYTIQIVSEVLDLQNYNELYDETTPIETLPQVVEDKVYGTDNYAIKFMSTYFSGNWSGLKFENIKWDIFDHIIFTERDDVASHLASWYAIFDYNQDIHPKLLAGEDVTREIKQEYLDEQVNGFHNILNGYKKYRNKLREMFPERCMTLKYEMFQKPKAEYLDELNKITNFNFTEEKVFNKRKERSYDYKKIFTNYDKLEEVVKSWNFTYDD